MLRDHGPRDPYLKLAVFSVNAFMGETGACHPSQEAVATAAGLGVTTVRRKLAEACRLGWLAQFPRAQAGQRWKAIEYVACIPDHIDTAKYDRREDKWRAEHGIDIPAEALRGTLYPQKMRAKAPAATAGPSITRNAEAPAADDKKDRPLTSEAPAADDKKDRPQRPTKFLREVLQEEVVFGKGRSPLGGLAPANGQSVPLKDMRGVRTAEPLHERLRKARALLAADPRIGDDTLCQMFRLTREQATEARGLAA